MSCPKLKISPLPCHNARPNRLHDNSSGKHPATSPKQRFAYLGTLAISSWVRLLAYLPTYLPTLRMTANTAPTEPTQAAPPPPPQQSKAFRREKFLEAIQQASIFGGSITFALIVGSNAPPTTGRFSDQTVRDFLAAAWLLFFIALGGATLARLRATAGGKEESIFTWREGSGYRFYVIGIVTFSAFCVLAVVVLAYSDVGWAALGVMGTGTVYVGFKSGRRRWWRAKRRRTRNQEEREG